jgi:glycogen debranching enzyme
MVDEHLLDPDEFWGDFVIPSIARSDPSFAKQRYWKGAIWPPLNFLVYLGLRQAGMEKEAEQLAEKSLALFLSEFGRRGYVSENYSSINGRGDDPRLSSDRFHSWGVLMGLPIFIEWDQLPAPEEKLTK